MHAPLDAELPLHACSNLKRMTELPSVQLLHSPSNAVPLCCDRLALCSAFMLFTDLLCVRRLYAGPVS